MTHFGCEAWGASEAIFRKVARTQGWGAGLMSCS
jgi:hypothetical protein